MDPIAPVVVGPPGSGKSTFCQGLAQFLRAQPSDAPLRRRRPVLVNLDPANERVDLCSSSNSNMEEENADRLYPFDIDICECTTVEQIMADERRGPNGALLKALQSIDLDWLDARLQHVMDAEDDCEPYFIIDVPGQVEVCTCDDSLVSIIRHLEQKDNFRLVVAHLSDAAHCVDSDRYISMLLVTLRAMMHLECPQINILSKMDLVLSSLSGGSLPMPLEYYLDASNLKEWIAFDTTDNGVNKRGRLQGLTDALISIVEDMQLVSFAPLAVSDRECMAYVLRQLDLANGWVFGGLTVGNESIMAASMGVDLAAEHVIDLVKQRYLEQTFDDCELSDQED